MTGRSISVPVANVRRDHDGVHLDCDRCRYFQDWLNSPTYRCGECDLIWLHEMERRSAKSVSRAKEIALIIIVLVLMYGLAAANCFSGSTV
jgi:hypothetical protein